MYKLVKGLETIEVMEGREDRRDQLIRAGYVWVNEAKAGKSDPPKAEKAERKIEVAKEDKDAAE